MRVSTIERALYLPGPFTKKFIFLSWKICSLYTSTQQPIKDFGFLFTVELVSGKIGRNMGDRRVDKEKDGTGN
jgi:hypothetical protein